MGAIFHSPRVSGWNADTNNLSRTDGYACSNKVLVVTYWDKGMPKPPSTRPEIGQTTLVKKFPGGENDCGAELGCGGFYGAAPA